MDSLLNWLLARFRIIKVLANGVSVGTYLIVDYFFDFVLYYLAIRFFGPIVGGGTVAIAGILIDLAVLRAYDRYGKDVFGLEDLKSLREYEGESAFRHRLALVVRKGNLLAVAVIAFYSNPCLATIYMRPKNERRRNMNVRDWSVFAVSACIEIFWIAFVYGFVLLEKEITSSLF